MLNICCVLDNSLAGNIWAAYKSIKMVSQNRQKVDIANHLWGHDIAKSSFVPNQAYAKPYKYLVYIKTIL